MICALCTHSVIFVRSYGCISKDAQLALRLQVQWMRHSNERDFVLKVSVALVWLFNAIVQTMARSKCKQFGWEKDGR